MVSELMTRLQRIKGLDKPPDPWEHFDVIAGTGTGGVVACMLGRLKMPIQEVIKSYTRLVKDTFSERKLFGTSTFKTAVLKDAIQTIVRESGNPENEPMVNPSEDNCKVQVMVFAMTKHNLNARIPTIFRSYQGHANQAPECAIWEALCATMAHPEMFKSIKIGSEFKEYFVDGGIGCNNPLVHALAEVKAMYPKEHVASIVSIGAGHTGTIQLPKSTWSQKILPTSIVVAMKGIAEDCERIAEDMAIRFEKTNGVYYRFNVDQGLQSVKLDELERLNEVATHTRIYMKEAIVTGRMDQAAQAIADRNLTVPCGKIDGQLQPDPSRLLTVKRCPAPTPVFTGRKDKLQQIEMCILGDQDERRVCVVYGLGGAGKTQVVLKAVERTRRIWTTLLYIDASSQESIEGALTAFAVSKTLGTTYTDTINWPESRSERWLLIFDNADVATLNLRQYFPGCNHGSIIVTSRLQDMALIGQGPGSDCNISSMNPQDAFDLLVKTARIHTFPLEPKELEEATALSNDLGHLALAIVQAGAYIRQTATTISKYRQLFLEKRQATLEEYSTLLVKVDEYHKTVYTTWKFCYELISKRPHAPNMLWLIAFLHFDGITEAIFHRAANNMTRTPVLPLSELEIAALDIVKKFLESFLGSDGKWESLKFLRVMKDISSYSLVELDKSNQAYRIHVLVQDWARNTIPYSANLALECANTLLSLAIDDDQSSDALTFKRNLGLHIADVMSMPRDTAYVSSYPAYFAMVYDAREESKKSADLWAQALRRHREPLGNEDPSTLRCMHQLASAFHRQARWSEAEQLQTQVVTTRKRLLGVKHPDTLRSMHKLASTYQDQGRWTEAKYLQTEVVELQKQSLGPEHLDTLSSMHKLGSISHDLGDWEDAAALATLVMNARIRLLGDDHPDTLATMNNLAAVYYCLNRFDEAEKLQVEVMKARNRMFGPKHPSTLLIMHNIALTFHGQRRYDEAARLETEVLDIWKHTLSTKHPTYLMIVGALAMVYQELDRQGEAEILQVQAVAGWKELVGDEDPRTLTAVNNLAMTYRNCRRFTDAERLQLGVVKTQRRVLGDQHPDTLTTMGNLALIFQDQSRYENAEKLQYEAVCGWQKRHGRNHSRTLAAVNHLAWTYRLQGRTEEAKSILNQTEFLPDHPGKYHKL